MQGKSKTYNKTRPSLCCMQVVNINTFRSNQAKRVFNIYYIITCKSQWIIYLQECILCNIQHIGKSETSLNIRLNNHQKDVSNPKATPAYPHFRKEGHNFTLIEQLTKMENVSKVTNVKTSIKP